MGFAGIATKVIAKPGVLGAILGGAGGVGIMSLLGGGGTTAQTVTQTPTLTPTGGDTYNTTSTPSYVYEYDYSTRNQITNIVDSPFASASPTMSGGQLAGITPSTTTTTDTRAKADATTTADQGTGLDLMSVAIVGGLALGGIFLLTGGLKK